MIDFVLDNMYFGFNKQIKQQISVIAIGARLGPHYACFFMNKIETVFLETQELQLLVRFRYINDIFYLDTW